MKALTLSFVLLALNAQAEDNLKWATGPFWRAPQVTEMSQTIKPLDRDLIESCENYKKLVNVYMKDEPSEFLAKKFERFRSEPLMSSMAMSFKGRFAINAPAFKYLLESEVDISAKNSDRNLDFLPMYNQTKSVTGIDMRNMTSIKPRVLAGSFTSFSRALGLEDSNATLTYDAQGQAVIVVDGRDLACDLIAKKAQLTSDVLSYVRLPEEAAKDIVEFYNFKVAPVIESAIAKPADSLTVKSAKLGFRLGKVLEEKTDRIEGEMLEKQMTNIMGLLFLPKTLTPSSKLIEVNSKKAIDISSTIDGDSVKLTLGVM